MNSLPWYPWFSVISTVLVTTFRAFALKRVFWNAPLDCGTSFFFGAQVPSGFYDGTGRAWLARYHHTLILELALEALLLPVTIVVSVRLLFPWWVALQVWVFLGSILFTLIGSGFRFYARARLGAHPPILTNFAVSLESRRLADYISWPSEALMGIIIGLCWGRLIHHHYWAGDWRTPILTTYLVAGFLPLKIEQIRANFPVPTDQPEAHYRWIDARRRNLLKGVDLLRWTFTFLLADFTLLHTWHPWRISGPGAWIRWSVFGSLWVLGVIIGINAFRDQLRNISMGRKLRPISSWSTPFGPVKSMGALTPWSVIWFVGLIPLLVLLPQ